MAKVFHTILYHDPLNQKSRFGTAVTAIIRNLQHILNTRSSVGIKKFLDPSFYADNLTFGLPDLTSLSMRSDDDRKTLVAVLEKAIDLFESRLENVVINLSTYDSVHRKLEVNVSAILTENDIQFSFLLNLSTMEFQINERERK